MKVAAVMKRSQIQPGLEQNVLLEIQTVDVCGVATTVLFDSGSSATLVTHKFAQEVGLEGSWITYYPHVVGQGYAKKSTLIYELTLEDKQGPNHTVHALGIDTISEEVQNICLDGVRYLFPYAPPEAFIRPGGEIQLLIGPNYRQLQPWAD